MAYSTQQKKAIFQVLERSKVPLTPVEILEKAQESVPKIGIATIYRQLNTLQNEGQVTLLEIPQSTPRYLLSRDLSSAYMLCSDCKKAIPLKDELHELNSLSQTQFEVSSYQVFFYGTCKERCKDSLRNTSPPQNGVYSRSHLEQTLK